MGAKTQSSFPQMAASMLSWGAQRVKDASKEESSQLATRKARMTVPTFIINCFT